jgi:hypothetical protein
MARPPVNVDLKLPGEDKEKPLKWASVDSPITGLKGGVNKSARQETLRGRLPRLSAWGPRDVQSAIEN